jgi:DNA-binding transcriptional regulator YhcF (GntR family)
MHSELAISQADSRPMYLQIMEQIRQRVAVGDWPPGAEVPSIRQLASSLRVSVITVKRAYRELEQEGVIVTRHGKGSMVAQDPSLSNRLYEEELEGLLDQAARLGAVLGHSPAALAARLRETAEKVKEEGA